MIGTCSRCGGPVTVPEHWMGTQPPILSCQRCGATKRQPYGPVIEMDEPPVRPNPRPPFEAFTDPLYKMCLAFGNGCGHCEKCEWEKKQRGGA